MKNITKKKLIYVRYILPPVLIAFTLVMMLIPAYLFVIDGSINDGNVSALTLMKNSYNESRKVLFAATEQQSAATLVFARTLLTFTIVFPLLFALGFAVSVYSSVVAIRYFTSDDEDSAERSRTLFVTFFPNRICLFAAELIVFPLYVFPYIMSPLYGRLYDMNVVLLLRAPDALIFGAVAFAAIIVLSVICAPMEREFGADIFRKRKGFEDKADEESEDELYRETEDEDTVGAANERNARIRELLLKNKKD